MTSDQKNCFCSSPIDSPVFNTIHTLPPFRHFRILLVYLCSGWHSRLTILWVSTANCTKSFLFLFGLVISHWQWSHKPTTYKIKNISSFVFTTWVSRAIILAIKMQWRRGMHNGNILEKYKENMLKRTIEIVKFGT
jgi:hypothetical protein